MTRKSSPKCLDERNMHQGKSKHPHKRAKLERSSYKFSNAVDIRRALQNQDENGQIEGMQLDYHY